MSYEVNESNINVNDSYTKTRTRLACNSCRQKKIKCDGEQPCSNCINNPKADCNYTERLRRRTKKEILESISKDKPIKNVSNLSNRLSRLEDLIVNLVNKKDDNVDEKKVSSASNDKSSLVNSIGINGSSKYEEHLNRTLSCSELQQDHAPAIQPKDENILEDCKNDQFIGAHCIISIFSDKSMKWIENALSPNDAYLVNGIKNLPRVVHLNMHSFIDRWLNPPKLTKREYINIFESPFPKNSEFVFTCIDAQFSTSMLENICEKEFVLRLFEEYYQHKKKKFRPSELLLMSMALAICICCQIDESLSSKTSTPVSSTGTSRFIDSMSADDLLRLHNDLFNKATYYYHSVSLIHEGLLTIQGILFLIIYIESNHTFTFVSFTLISVAMRIAQSLGMHRIESYSKLSRLESEKRLAVWTTCTFLDIEISFRTGKPPHQSVFDTSPSMDDMIYVTYVSHMNNSKMQHTVGLFSKNNFIYYNYYFQLLERIRFRSYSELFSANTKNKSTGEVFKTLDDLNYEMFKLAHSMNFDDRPILQNDPDYHELSELLSAEERTYILKIHLTFFSNLIIINRVPSLLDDTSFFKNPNETAKYRDYTLNAARTILMLNKAWTRDSTSFSFYHYSLFHSITGYMALCSSCINHPELPNTFNDIQILKAFSISILECHSKWTSKESVRKHFSGLIVVSLILRMMLLFAVKAYEYKMDISIIERDLNLRAHIESLRKECPDIYNAPNTFKIARNLEDFDREIKPNFTSDTMMRPTNSISPHSNGRVPMPLTSHTESGSRSPMPVSNLLNPNVPTPSSTPNLYNELLIDNDPDLGYSVLSQMTNFPNFFFDNNLGV